MFGFVMMEELKPRGHGRQNVHACPILVGFVIMIASPSAYHSISAARRIQGMQGQRTGDKIRKWTAGCGTVWPREMEMVHHPHISFCSLSPNVMQQSEGPIRGWVRMACTCFARCDEQGMASVDLGSDMSHDRSGDAVDTTLAGALSFVIERGMMDKGRARSVRPAFHKQ